MQVKISKTLEGIIARAAFNTTKAGIDHSLKDFLMLEMLREEGSLAYQLLSSRLKDWELYQVRLRIEREVLGAGRRENTGAEEFYRAFTDELCAVSGATRSVSTAHALRAIVGDRSTATSRVLEMYGITGEVVSEDIKKFAAGDDFRTEIQVHMLDFGEENKPEEKNTSHVLDKFGVNLTQMAREGKIDPVVGREQEIERVVQILSRRKKNNPILIGEAGVGKSAIIEGLALRIAGGEGPYTIADALLARRIVARGGHEVPRRIRGAHAATARRTAQSQGHDHIHRRDTHHRGCRFDTGQPRHGQHPQTGTRTGRTADHRRHDARRIPREHRK